MNIIYACDDCFAEIMGISMLSLFDSNKNADEIIVYILDSGITDSNKEKLFSVADKYSRRIVFLSVDGLLDKKMKQKRGSLATFSRLYAAQLLPEDIDTALYLDCDILVLDDLSEMYNTEIDGYYGAAVKDCVSEMHKKSVGLLPSDNYFNAGVYLMNIRKWRNAAVSEKAALFSQKYNNRVPYADQGILNGVTAKKTKCLELKYNCYTILYDFDYKHLMLFRKPSGYYSEAEIADFKKAPAIIHFTTCFLSLRPWVSGCNHPYAAKWRMYKEMSPWSGQPLREDNRNAIKRVGVGIYRLLPQKTAASIAGFFHAEIMLRFRR